VRVIRYRKAGREFYFFVNEGEGVVAGDLSLAATGAVEYWDPLDGTTRPWPAQTIKGRTHTRLRLERRQGVVLALDPNGEPDSTALLPPLPGQPISTLTGPWQAQDETGQPIDLPCPGDWAQAPAWETFSGRLQFLTEFSLSPEQTGQPLFLDLGQAGDIAEVYLNDQRLGVRAWAPYYFNIAAAAQAGHNSLLVRITNSMANAYEGLQLPSGLLGPVTLRAGGPYAS
jgi:hypothetical protein